MNKLYYFVCFIFLSAQISFGQSHIKDKIESPFLFTDNNKIYLLTSDSIFDLSYNPWSARKHSLTISNYSFVGNQTNSFLINDTTRSALVFKDGVFITLNNDYVLGHSRIPLQIGLPTYIYILGLILLPIITALIVHYRKKDQRVNLANLNNDSLELLESELNQEELMLFKKIFFAAPKYISFPELMTIYDQDLTYDSLKKKLRHSLTEIEKKSQILLKINRNIFEERRSVEDKRIKCIRIMP